MIDYITVDEKLRKDELDGERDAVLVKMKLKDRWEYGRKSGKEKLMC